MGSTIRPRPQPTPPDFDRDGHTRQRPRRDFARAGRLDRASDREMRSAISECSRRHVKLRVTVSIRPIKLAPGGEKFRNDFGHSNLPIDYASGKRGQNQVHGSTRDRSQPKPLTLARFCAIDARPEMEYFIMMRAHTE